MTALVLADKARMYVQRLCRDIPTRRVGSHGNRLATDFFAETVAALYAGQEVALDIRAQRIPATGCNVIARKGTDPACRLVVCAHIDAKEGTPGALDNAS